MTVILALTLSLVSVFIIYQMVLEYRFGNADHLQLLHESIGIARGGAVYFGYTEDVSLLSELKPDFQKEMYHGRLFAYVDRTGMSETYEMFADAGIMIESPYEK